MIGYYWNCYWPGSSIIEITNENEYYMWKTDLPLPPSQQSGYFIFNSSVKLWSERWGIEPGTPGWKSFVLYHYTKKQLKDLGSEMSISVALEIVAQFRKFSFVIVIPHLICVFNNRWSRPKMQSNTPPAESRMYLTQYELLSSRPSCLISIWINAKRNFQGC